MDIIVNDMNVFHENGIDGFVFGALTPDRQLDIPKCEKIIQHANGLPVTFHRAFDMTIPAQKLENIGKLVDCKFSRLLTSGFAETAELGLKNLIALQDYVREKQLNLIIMPGCGININNAEKILKAVQDCKEFHASARTCINDDMPVDESDTIAIKNEIYTNSVSVSDQQTVERLVQVGQELAQH